MLKPAGTCAGCGEWIPEGDKRISFEIAAINAFDIIMIHRTVECLDKYVSAEEAMYDDEDVAHEDMTP